MAKHATHKSTSAGKARTVQLRAARRSKRTERPLDVMALQREIGKAA